MSKSKLSCCGISYAGTANFCKKCGAALKPLDSYRNEPEAGVTKSRTTGLLILGATVTALVAGWIQFGYFGEGDQWNYQQQQKHLQECQANNGDSCSALGVNYELGYFPFPSNGWAKLFDKDKGERVDFEKAIALHEKGCGLGFADACAGLGRVLHDKPGLQASLDHEKALRKACNLKSALGCYFLASFENLPREEKLEAFTTACKLGESRACDSQKALVEEDHRPRDQDSQRTPSGIGTPAAGDPVDTRCLHSYGILHDGERRCGADKVERARCVKHNGPDQCAEQGCQWDDGRETCAWGPAGTKERTDQESQAATARRTQENEAYDQMDRDAGRPVGGPPVRIGE